MPRKKSPARQLVLEKAMNHFWFHGFFASSLDDLVRATGVSRHALYEDFGSKDGLFVATLLRYVDTVVTPAFSRVESQGAGLAAISDYWEVQIANGEAAGLPGPGCLLANTMTEYAPQAPQIAAIVAQHNARLRAGFANALRSDGIATRHKSSKPAIEATATMLVVFSNGLWSFSRTTSDARALRNAARTMSRLLASEG
jgi:TetR/AcrR family transcriptional regulator, transcriptional repressor for nem operon